MIALTSASSCGICLEVFRKDPAKIPCSLQCGHIFCYVCLPNIPSHLCPLCRKPFTSVVKLHLDVDDPLKGFPMTPPLNIAQSEQEARRLLGLFDKALDHGCSEVELKGLLEECKAFLSNQPRSVFSELRTINRLMSYLYKVKGNLVAQTQSNNLIQSQINQLRSEKEDLEQRLKEVKSTRRSEQKTAHNVEKILRDHCSRAHTAYEAIVQQYNFVVQEWMRLQDEITRMQASSTLQLGPATPDLDLEPDLGSSTDLAETPQSHFATELDQTNLKEAAVQRPYSLLISPLPQFIGQLPDALPLPDDDEGREIQCGVDQTTAVSVHQDRSPAPSHSEVPSTSLTGCNAPNGHPSTCNCKEVSFLANSIHETPRPAITNSVPTPVLPAEARSSPQTSGLSDTSLSHGRSRSQTIPASSRPPSCSPSLKSYSNARDLYGPVSGQSSLRNREPESLKSRLRDLLQDEPNTSTSLPNVSSNHFPSSLTREIRQQDSRQEALRVDSDHGNMHPPTQISSVASPKQGEECARISPPAVIGYAGAVAPSAQSTHSSISAPVISRASNAAMAMERERREKKEQERERRRTEQRLAESQSLGRSNSTVSTSTSGISSTRINAREAHNIRTPAPY